MRLYRFQGAGPVLEKDGTFYPLNSSISEFVERSKTSTLELNAAVECDPAKLLVPCEPSKIVCVGLNYRRHAEEMNKQIPPEPLLFLKPPSALNPANGAIHLPSASEEVHHEGELAIIIGKRARKVSVKSAMDHVLGYTCANDVTARDIQRRESRYTRGKGYDTFCVLGPCIVTPDEFQLSGNGVSCAVNGEPRQHGMFDDFIFDIPTVISFVSHIMTLEPEDVILTGTPSGVGPIKDGDVVEVTISGIGQLRNPVSRV